MDFKGLAEAYKPAATMRVHALLAASMWSAVGTVLAVVGGRWVVAAGLAHGRLLMVGAALAGGLKSRLVLEGAAERALDRIRCRGDGKCAGGFLSAAGWGFVAAMMGLGAVLRSGVLPRWVVGLVYVAVGTGLVIAGRRLWVGWYRLSRRGV